VITKVKTTQCLFLMEEILSEHICMSQELLMRDAKQRDRAEVTPGRDFNKSKIILVDQADQRQDTQ